MSRGVIRGVKDQNIMDCIASNGTSAILLLLAKQKQTSDKRSIYILTATHIRIFHDVNEKFTGKNIVFVHFNRHKCVPVR